MKISEIIQKLVAFHPPIDESHTTDVVKWGDPNKECTGIVVTCFASSDVIREAARLGANLIIAHSGFGLFFEKCVCSPRARTGGLYTFRDPAGTKSSRLSPLEDFVQSSCGQPPVSACAQADPVRCPRCQK